MLARVFVGRVQNRVVEKWVRGGVHCVIGLPGGAIVRTLGTIFVL
jgi:hypothetical protein